MTSQADMAPAPDRPAGPSPVHAPAIALVGIDGAGKTTQGRLLADALRHERAAWLPNDVGKAVRGALDRWAAAGGHADHQARLGPDAAFAVWAGVKAAALLAALTVARDAGALLIADRWTYCQYATDLLHGAGEGGFLRDLHADVPTPLLTLFLDLDPAEAARRTHARGTEVEDVATLRRYRAAYRQLPEFPTFVVLDASGPAHIVHRRVLAAARGALGEERVS